MTEGDRAYYKRRIKEEMRLAGMVHRPDMKELHLRWAKFFSDRLDGKRSATPPALPQH